MINQVEVKNVYKNFGDVKAVDGVSLEISQGQFFSLLGPSGCGKTTLLRLIAGFEMPNSGDISIDNKSMDGIAPNLRPTNMVFQNYAIFPHLNVEENVAYGLRKKRLSKDEKLDMINKSLELVGLSGLNNRSSNALSGGQKQRIAIARAFLKDAPILLLEEATSSLDSDSESKIQFAMEKLTKGRTTIVVAHRLATVRKADNIIVLDDGKIVESGSHSSLISKDGFYTNLCRLQLFSE